MIVSFIHAYIKLKIIWYFQTNNKKCLIEMFGLFLNSLSKVSADSSVLSYKSKIFAIYCDLKKNWYIFFSLN